MPTCLDRRDLLVLAPAAGLAALGFPAAIARASERRETDPAKPADAPGAPSGAWPNFPRQDSVLVAEIVGAAHRDEAKVRALLDAHPALANAAWDWGFGDWETPLGAAAHTGRRSIAELLLERGARIDIFAAAMLGWTDVVKGFLTAAPNLAGSFGPHGLTLAHHARAGGDRAQSVAEFLRTIPQADAPTPTVVLTPEALGVFAGTYAYGANPTDRFAIAVKNTTLEFVLNGSRRLNAVAPTRFFPSGVPSVNFNFDAEAKSLTIIDHDVRVAARRVDA